MFKKINETDVQVQQTKELFYYDIRELSIKDFSLSSFTKFYITSLAGSLSSNYLSISNKFYQNQRNSDFSIIPSSYIEEYIGSSTANNLIIFSLDSKFSKDGISNIKPKENIVINCDAHYHLVDFVSPTEMFTPSVTSIIEHFEYEFFDERTSLTAGNIKIRVFHKNPGAFTLLTELKEVVVGKIFYEYSLVLIDSLNYGGLADNSGNTFLIPHPAGTEDMFYLDSENYLVKPDSNGIYFNQKDEWGTFPYVEDSYYNLLIINSIKLYTKINKNSYFFNLDIDNKSFNYSKNSSVLTSSNGDIENFNTIATEESPLWFSTVYLYDYKNNVIATGRLSNPIKKTNKRNINLKFKLDL